MSTITPPPAAPPVETPPVVTPPVTPPAGTPPAAPPSGTPPAAPIVYDLKIPEGSRAIQADVDQILAFAKEKNLPNDQAVLLLDQRHAAYEAAEVRAKEVTDANIALWQEQLKADQTLGGAKYAETSIAVKTVLDRVLPESTPFGKELRESPAYAAISAYPPLVAAFAALAQIMKEDKGLGGAPPAGGGGEGTPKSDEAIFFPNRV